MINGRVALLLSAGIAYFAVVGLSFPVLPRLVDQELDGGDAEIGLVFGSLAIGMLAVRPFVGYLSDRFGRRTMMIAGALAIAGLQLTYVPAAGVGLWLLLLVRVLAGMAGSAMYVAQATVATELGPAARRGSVFAIFSVAVVFGFAIGPVIGETVLKAEGVSAAFAVGAVISVLSAMCSFLLPETRPSSVSPAFEGIRHLLHPVAVRVGLVNMMVFVAFMGFNGFITPYAESLGVESSRWILLTYALTSVLARLVGGPLFDRADRLRLATVAFSLIIAGALVLAAADTGWHLYVGAFVLASGLAFNVPLMMLIGVDSTDEADRARVVGTIATFGDLANSVGALALGLLADATSYSVMYIAIALSVLGAQVLLRSPLVRDLPGLEPPAPPTPVAVAR